MTCPDSPLEILPGTPVRVNEKAHLRHLTGAHGLVVSPRKTNGTYPVLLLRKEGLVTLPELFFEQKELDII